VLPHPRRAQGGWADEKQVQAPVLRSSGGEAAAALSAGTGQGRPALPRSTAEGGPFSLPAAWGWRCPWRKEFTPDGKEILMNCLKQCLLFPKFNCGCGLVTLALALAWPAHGADFELIGQWPGWPRGGVPMAWR
jgi:hypothetical protein